MASAPIRFVLITRWFLHLVGADAAQPYSDEVSGLTVRPSVRGINGRFSVG
jgi:hypothetical protein